jgi:hypothetical protein
LFLAALSSRCDVLQSDSRALSLGVDIGARNKI